MVPIGVLVSVGPRELSPQDQSARAALDALRTQAEALLTLLPVVETPPPDTESLADQPPDRLSARLKPVEEQTQVLTRHLLDAEEEHELLRAYGRALEVLTPLLALLAEPMRLEKSETPLAS